MNKDQAKHFAGTLRAIAFAQFATYGYVSFQQETWTGLAISSVLFIWLESIAFFALKGEKNG